MLIKRPVMCRNLTTQQHEEALSIVSERTTLLTRADCLDIDDNQIDVVKLMKDEPTQKSLYQARPHAELRRLQHHH